GVVQELCSQNVGVSFFTAGGWYYGTLAPHSEVNVQTRIAQFRTAATEGASVRLARAFVAGKILNCRTLLRRNAREKPEKALAQLRRLAGEAESTESIESLLGIEGAAARAYFQAFSGMLTGSGGRRRISVRRTEAP